MSFRRPTIAMLLVGVMVGPATGLAQIAEWFKKGRDAFQEPVPAKQIAHFHIAGELTETPITLPPLFGGEPPLSLKGLLERLKEARADYDVVAVVVDLQEAQMGLGQIEEVHRALRAFSAVDKPVYIHADALTTMTYALATGASHISLVPTGEVWLMGLYGETPYLRGMLDKVGVQPDFEHFEDYKTAVEILTNREPSEAQKKMLKWLLDGIYDALVRRIGDGRSMPTEKVKKLIDSGPYTAEEALAAGLIDSVQHRQDFLAELEKRHGEDVEVVTDYGEEQSLHPPSDPFALFSFLMQLLNPSPKEYTQPSVAVVYVDGSIQTGSAQPSPFGGSEGAFSTTIRKALDKAAGEESVKAVVLRVDSPGGSALASEIILDATKRVAKEKPLIVSMGNVAGSGGYYVACGAETIFADSATITASIGVLGGKLVTTAMWDKLNIHWHAEQRGEMAAMMSSAAAFSDKERAKLRATMGETYKVFKQHVVNARGKRLTKPIEEIAGGRVFTGEQALQLGLVDRIGGLEEAIKFAAERAALGEYEIRVIPEPPSLFDLFGGGAEDDYAWSLVQKPSSILALPEIRTLLEPLTLVDPLRAKAVLRALQCLELIREEGVVAMMPYELLIR